MKATHGAAASAAARRFENCSRPAPASSSISGAASAAATAGSRRPQQQQQLAPPVRIVSWNVLADKWAAHHAYCPPELLAWPSRYPRILAQLEALQPDLLCLQEVQADVYGQQLEPWMAARGWGSVFAPRAATQASTTLGPCDGVTLHYRQSKFQLLASEQVRFADHAAALLPGACCGRHAAASSSSGGAGPSAFMQALLQREEGAVLALLRHEPSQHVLVACSTHLHWNPQVPDIKVAQAALLCHCISRFVQQQGQQQQQQQHQQHALCDIPVVVGGDFNSLWRKYNSDMWDKVPEGQDSILSGVYELMSSGQVAPSHHDHPANRQHCRECGTTSSSSNGNGSGRNGGGKAGKRSRSSSPKQQQPQPQQQPGLCGYTFTTSGLDLQSSYFAAWGREPALTTRTTSFEGTLDYIWLSKRHWCVASTLSMPYKQPAEPHDASVLAFEACPNAQQPSDHLAVGCEAALLLPVEQGGGEAAAAAAPAGDQQAMAV